jgi:hypothetical protein
MNRHRTILTIIIGAVVAAMLASALLTSTAQQSRKALETLPAEIDVRVRGGVLSGKLSDTASLRTESAAAALSLRPNGAQSKSMHSLERAANSSLSVEYNRLTGTPRHMFATNGYLSSPSQDNPEKIAREFIQRSQGIFRFSDADMQSLRLEPNYLPDLGSTILCSSKPRRRTRTGEVLQTSTRRQRQ